MMRGSPTLAGIFGAHRLHESSSPKSVTPSAARSRPAATLFALVKEEGAFNTRVRLTGEAPKVTTRSRGAATIAMERAIFFPFGR